MCATQHVNRRFPWDKRGDREPPFPFLCSLPESTPGKNTDSALCEMSTMKTPEPTTTVDLNFTRPIFYPVAETFMLGSLGGAWVLPSAGYRALTAAEVNEYKNCMPELWKYATDTAVADYDTGAPTCPHRFLYKATLVPGLAIIDNYYGMGISITFYPDYT